MRNGSLFKLTLISILLMLSACNWNKKTEFVPVYMEIPIVHPEPYSGFKLNDPKIEVMDKTSIENRIKSIRDGELLYILDEHNMRKLLEDDVSKLEYLQHESMRANFYKKYIDDYNSRIKDRNHK